MRRIPPRLAQHQFAQLIVIGLQPFHFFIDGVSRNMWDTAGNNPHRCSGMRIDGMDHSLERHMGFS